MAPLLIAVVLAIGSSATPPADAGPPDGRPAAATTCEFIDIPRAGEPWLQRIAADEDGGVWLISNARLFGWTGEEFREAMPGAVGFGDFVGGRDRGLYATQRGRTAREGLLHSLRNEVAKPVCTYYVDGGTRRPTVYVSRTGRLLNWGNRYLAVRRDGTWKRVEASLSRDGTQVFDVGDEVYVYHDNTLYCVDADGGLHERDCPQWEPGGQRPGPVVGALWGGRRALLFAYGGQKLFAFDLPTGRVIDLAGVGVGCGAKRFYDAFALRNGDVWVLGAAERIPGYVFFRLTPEGVMTRVPATHRIPWENHRIRQTPTSVLEMSTGEIAFGLQRHGLVVYRDDAASLWGWEHGFTQNICCLCEDASGAIWFPLETKVARLRLGTGPPPLTALADQWEEFPLMPRTDIWQLAPGEVAMFRTDHPNILSRWDGREWRYQELPHDAFAGDYGTAVDDRGHLLVSGRVDAPNSFDIGPDSVEPYDTVEALLEAAVAEGAREFSCVEGFAGLAVSPDGRIWFGKPGGSGAKTYDGQEWHDFPCDEHVTAIRQSPEHGVLFRVWYENFYRHDNGRLVELPASLTEGGRLMLSETGLWPYERELMEQDPGRCFPVLMRAGACVVFLRVEDFESACGSASASAYARFADRLPPEGSHTARLSDHAGVVRRLPSRGAWILVSSPSGVLRRVINGEFHEATFSDTPLADRKIENVLEDGAGNLWFRTGGPRWSAFRERATDAR
jgi:hypothetical protein